MKVEVKETTKKEFKPFDLNIRVESLDDLCMLWACFNTTLVEIKDSVDKEELSCGLKSGVVRNALDSRGQMDNKNRLWNTLNNKLKEQV